MQESCNQAQPAAPTRRQPEEECTPPLNPLESPSTPPLIDSGSASASSSSASPGDAREDQVDVLETPPAPDRGVATGEKAEESDKIGISKGVGSPSEDVNHNDNLDSATKSFLAQIPSPVRKRSPQKGQTQSSHQLKDVPPIPISTAATAYGI